MSQLHILEFALKGTVARKSISASGGVPFAKFSEFNADVQKYILGSESRKTLRYSTPGKINAGERSAIVEFSRARVADACGQFMFSPTPHVFLRLVKSGFVHLAYKISL